MNPQKCVHLYSKKHILGTFMREIKTISQKSEDIATLEIEDPYAKELVEAWCRLNLSCNPISFSSMPIWYNSSVCINGKPFFFFFFQKSWFVVGVTTVSNLLYDTSSGVLTFKAFKEKYTVKANFLQYCIVVTALLKAKTNFVFNQTSNTELTTSDRLIERQASLPQRNQDESISDFQACAVED